MYAHAYGFKTREGVGNLGCKGVSMVSLGRLVVHHLASFLVMVSTFPLRIRLHLRSTLAHTPTTHYSRLGLGFFTQ